MSDPTDPAAAYRSALPYLQRARKHYKKQVRKLLSDSISDYYLISRVKTARSLIRKLHEDPEHPRAWDSVTDKVGVRVVCSTKADCNLAAEILRQGPWTVRKYDKKRGRHDRLYYPGIHLEIEAPEIVDHEGAAVWCEVQIRTHAQDAWSIVAHKLTYKSLVKPPKKMKRQVNRLTIFVEVFDDEIQRIFKMHRKLPMYAQGQALEYLESKYEEVTGEPAQVVKDLSLMTILMRAYTDEEFSRLNELIDEFCSVRTDLAELVGAHNYKSESYEDRHDWLFTQPEVLMVLERATAKRHMLAGTVGPTDLDGVVRSTCIAAGLVLPDG